MRVIACSAAFALLLPGGFALGAGDAKRGGQLFRQCMACHSVQPGEQLTGPSLAQVWRHKAATVPGFARYSDALKRSGLTWDETTLDRWLANPEQFLPGNSMTFPGLREARDREDVTAYLRAVAEGKAPRTEQKGGHGMMQMQARKLDLREAPPEGQVKSIGHCRDTYTLETADGKTQKVWEFNLRFKSDSSKLGPLPGKPVVVGAGMQGDRASVVFATPSEISAFIKELCP